jgi:hypothetical protein
MIVIWGFHIHITSVGCCDWLYKRCVKTSQPSWYTRFNLNKTKWTKKCIRSISTMKQSFPFVFTWAKLGCDITLTYISCMFACRLLSKSHPSSHVIQRYIWNWLYIIVKSQEFCPVPSHGNSYSLEKWKVITLVITSVTGLFLWDLKEVNQLLH